MNKLDVRMLGQFSIRWGENQISDAGTRSKKSWNLLAYLICQRGRVLTQKKLIDVIWGEESDNLNPENTLRITLHRTRAQLDKLWPGAGKELIIHKEGGYTWSETTDITVDSDRFEDLCREKTGEEESRLEALLEGLALYKGEFLERHSSENWVVPVGAHFQNLYISAVLEAAQLLSSRDRHQEAAILCRKAVAVEPYHEQLHQHLIHALASSGDRKAASAVYDGLSRRLFDDFGIRPSEQTRALYRSCVHSPSDKTLPMDVLLEQLREPEYQSGALQCDYDYFKILCYAESRSMERSGAAAHVLMLALADPEEKPLTRRSQHRIMEQLGEQIRLNLRRGDTYCRCSLCQYIILLPGANYENSCMVARRILGAFNRAHPYVTAKFHFMVQPLAPGIRVP